MLPLSVSPSPVKFFAACLLAGDELWGSLEIELGRAFGKSDWKSPALSWSVSPYYEREMGKRLVRRLVSFEPLGSPADLAECKCRSRSLEDLYRDPERRQRRVNIDPGYLEAGKVVLASTKNANHRIYLNSGVYAEATLSYVSGAFRPYAYTYPDYGWPETLEFFACVRRRYLEQLKTAGRKAQSA